MTPLSSSTWVAGSSQLLASLGAPVSFDRVQALSDGGAIGRPHVARAMVAAGLVQTAGQAFAERAEIVLHECAL